MIGLDNGSSATVSDNTTAANGTDRMTRQGSYLNRPVHRPQRGRFPVIDAHNHLWSLASGSEVDAVAEVLENAGVVGFCDLTGNAVIAFADGGYRVQPRPFDFFTDEIQTRGGNRFYAFTMASFACDPSEPLFDDAEAFVATCIETLRDHVARGARGLKVLKELGLAHRDGSGNLLAVDDERLGPIWDHCATLAVPVLIHQSDPAGFFDPITPDNEHYDSLRKYPSWSFADPKYPRKAELLAARNRMIAAHPQTTFILPHVANQAEDLAAVAALLDEYPNVMIDFSARCDELGRQPYSARRFFMQYADRILFGTDMPPAPEIYSFTYRFLETDDEDFIPPDYDGTFDRYRWKVHGLYLPDDVLRKIYYRNACRVIPGLAEQLAGVLPDDAQPPAP